MIDAILPLIEAHYVFPEVGQRVVAALRDHVLRGDYDGVNGGKQFGRLVSDHLRAAANDKHFVLKYFDDADQAPTEDKEHAQLLANFGFVAQTILPGSVAYLRIDCFDRGAEEKGVMEAYARQMTAVAGAEALILDMRQNHGGDPSTIAVLLSYLFDTAPVRLEDIWDRDNGETWHVETRSDIAGSRFGGKKPVFVLTSGETFSGGEQVAYDLQTLRRATIIGETTGGGANPAPRHKIDRHFVLALPSARAINPVTHTNWEGVGVAPDVVRPAADALREAHARAIELQLAGLPEGATRAKLEAVLRTVR